MTAFCTAGTASPGSVVHGTGGADSSCEGDASSTISGGGGSSTATPSGLGNDRGRRRRGSSQTWHRDGHGVAGVGSVCRARVSAQMRSRWRTAQARAMQACRVLFACSDSAGSGGKAPLLSAPPRSLVGHARERADGAGSPSSMGRASAAKVPSPVHVRPRDPTRSSPSGSTFTRPQNRVGRGGRTRTTARRA